MLRCRISPAAPQAFFSVNRARCVFRFRPSRFAQCLILSTDWSRACVLQGGPDQLGWLRVPVRFGFHIVALLRLEFDRITLASSLPKSAFLVPHNYARHCCSFPLLYLLLSGRLSVYSSLCAVLLSSSTPVVVAAVGKLWKLSGLSRQSSSSAPVPMRGVQSVSAGGSSLDSRGQRLLGWLGPRRSSGGGSDALEKLWIRLYSSVVDG